MVYPGQKQELRTEPDSHYGVLQSAAGFSSREVHAMHRSTPQGHTAFLCLHWCLCCVHVSRRLAALVHNPFLCFSGKRILPFLSFKDQSGHILDVGAPSPCSIPLSELCILNASAERRVQLETVPQGRGAGCILRYSSAYFLWKINNCL